MNDSITSTNVFISSIKVSMAAVVEVTSKESVAKDFVEASVEVTPVEAFISSIYSMAASTEASMNINKSVKASINSAKASITSMKASIYAFVDVTSMEAFVEAFVEAPVEVT